MPHIHDKIDFTVEVFVAYNRRVLLRKHDKYKKWLSVGGHIELSEDPNEAAVREVKEEVGLEVKLIGSAPFFQGESDNYRELIPPISLNRHRINETHEHVTLVYFATAQTDILRPSQTEKSDELRWFTRKELEENTYGISESIRHYALKALNNSNPNL
jgi:8-oxo-dGTP pyrophosphatase MutT (NUDIX family)